LEEGSAECKVSTYKGQHDAGEHGHASMP